ncbi:MAG: DNA repair protein RadA [Candidatus Brocadia sp. AMX2]|uniref:DNA repair protein RadA n=1 Tax=Candidatus Brocadia sinica JPN1 TaxID=1197129 RepID=A0ABQ0JWA2_9BACT|nr:MULTISPECIES: DNA repair protein RadA [Brocadia]KXK29711.1 MAG: DNA repair protein RadA [Candidatus Brocadia sinica]MBC6931805.1 DNA repair protein RadA [Candidatus Brocadia sp.]MBL1167340.1 DNA repair protein RadA [Candidatus Brocadia sp. AMX1]NOG41186.1 DNA repair protein RadA [Planctomycetota bacterium]KAA0245742.1 MAG: DNA repair protein RadA [Candidatus Brocadia sp. AMX2]
MTKTNVVYVCQHCGWKSLKWVGRCGGCGEWDSTIEELGTPAGSGYKSFTISRELPQPITQVKLLECPSIETGMEEFDRILGGGLIAGSAVLIGGTPGIGKSTLLLQVCQYISKKGYTTLYVTGEESVAQTKLRAERLSILSDNLLVVAETNLDFILENIHNTRPTLVVIDSIQMIYKSQIESAPGTVAQVRQCANDLISVAKSTGSAIFLVGHVTKQGIIAGPKVLEHMADTVLYFEGEKFQCYRILRVVKNRFGSTDEIGIFEMRKNGLQPVDNPSEIFISQGRRISAGSAIISCMEGTRALLVEIQALVTRANFGMPERKVSGVDYNRVSMILAILEKRIGLKLGGQDVFVNIVGGVQVDEPAADLGIAMTITSSFKEKVIPSDIVFVGEVGLGGEVRSVSQIEIRLKEAQRLGFKRAIVPKDNTKGIANDLGIELSEVCYLSEAVEIIG